MTHHIFISVKIGAILLRQDIKQFITTLMLPFLHSDQCHHSSHMHGSCFRMSFTKYSNSRHVRHFHPSYCHLLIHLTSTQGSTQPVSWPSSRLLPRPFTAYRMGAFQRPGFLFRVYLHDVECVLRSLHMDSVMLA